MTYKPSAAERADQFAARLSGGGFGDSLYFRPVLFLISGLGAAVLYVLVGESSDSGLALGLLYYWAAVSTAIGSVAIAVILGTKHLRS